MTGARRLVVVGASLAGLRAVEAARRVGFDGEITLVGAEPHAPYDRPPLSKAFLEGPDPAPTVFRSLDELRGELGVDVRLACRATGLDPSMNLLDTDGGAVGYDALVIATGSTPRTLPVCDELGGVHVLRTIDDAWALRSSLDTGTKVVVVGAGFIGSEVASSASARGCQVTIVEAADLPLRRAVGSAGDQLVDLHRAHGTTVLCGTSVLGIEGEKSVERVHLSDGSVLAADVVVVGVGATPAVGWLAGSGLDLTDGVLCDATLWTGLPGVYAAGDVARWRNGQFGIDMRMENWTGAAEQGAVAGRNAVEPGRLETYSTVPYFWSDWYGHRIQFVGLADADRVEVIGDVRAHRYVALFGRDNEFVGSLGVNAQTSIMKYRALIKKHASLDEALAFQTPIAS